MLPLCSEKFVCCCSGRDSCMLPSRCMLPSLHPVPSSKLPPFCLPVSPVTRAARCKPCPVALVPILGCSRPPARNLDLVRSARPGRIIREDMFILKTKRSLHFRTRRVIPQEKKHRFTQIEKVPTKKTFCVKLSIYFKKKSSPGIYTRCAKCTTV